MMRKSILSVGASLLLAGSAGAAGPLGIVLPDHFRPQPADSHDTLTRALLPKTGGGSRFAYYHTERPLDLVCADLLRDLGTQGFNLAGGQHRAHEGVEAQTLLWVKQDTRLASNLAQIDGRGTLVQFIELASTDGS